MMKIARTATLVVALIALGLSAPLFAHEMTVKGTVVAIEKARIQVRTGQEPSGQAAAWYPIDAKTKIKRGKKELKIDAAKIKVEERVVLVVDHPSKGPMKTKEILLAVDAAK